MAEEDRKEVMEKLDPNAQVRTIDTSGTAAVSVSEQMEHVTPGLMEEYGHTDEVDSLAEGKRVEDGDTVDESGATAPGFGDEEITEEGQVVEDEDRPGGNASTDDWHAYRLAHGYSEEELDGLGRDELKDLDDR